MRGATRYERELNQLKDVYRAALKTNISPISRLVERISQSTLSTVGSGGSFSIASFAANLHEYRTGYTAKAMTPLDIISLAPKTSGTVCFSASGRNRDISVAFQIAAQSETGPVGALVLAKDTPLHTLQSRYTYTDVVGGSDPLFKDGFLAVASILASALLLKRAYDEVFGQISVLPDTLMGFAKKTIASNSFDFITTESASVIVRPFVSLLYSPTVSSTAVDLESRYVEAALGAIHTADFRNFGHGRHFWIAKRGSETGIIALAGVQDDILATRTLNLIPKEVETWRIDICGEPDEQAIAGLIIGLYISAAAGTACRIDPGKPGVPNFGRKLYSLGPGALKRKPSEVNRKIAIYRKAPEAFKNTAALKLWEGAYERAIGRWINVKISAIAFDYDGTLCDSRNRYGNLSEPIVSTIVKLLEKGIRIGIATGRGPSAGVALRNCLPRKYWQEITMGYYNGAVLTTLIDDRDPLIGHCEHPELIKTLSKHPVLQNCDIRSNAAQIALRFPSYLNVSKSISAVNTILSDYEIVASVSASNHAVDIQFGSISKKIVVDKLQNLFCASGIIMRMGDKGVWPGNDVELLDSPFGLSVDEVSRHTEHCWALAPAGVKGVQATLYYLSCLHVENGIGRLRLRPGNRGISNAT